MTSTNHNFITLDSTGSASIDRESADYWNDESLEKKKAFNVIDLGFDKIESSEKYASLLDQIDSVIQDNQIDMGGANILSVASGTCWVESQWLKGAAFKSLRCVDISRHRIHKLAPFTMEHYGIQGEVDFVCGSIFDMNDVADCYDIILLSQAFHHIEEPIRLLRFLKSKLSENGSIVIVGEHYYSNSQYHFRALKHFVKYLVNRKGYRRLRRFYPSWQDLFPPDHRKGDIHWSDSEYEFIFRKSGIERYHHGVHKSGLFQSFVIKQEENNAED